MSCVPKFTASAENFHFTLGYGQRDAANALKRFLIDQFVKSFF